MQEKMCDWCEVSKASTGRRDGERYCSDCDPYAWAAFVNPDTYEENKRIALMRVERRLQKENPTVEMKRVDLATSQNVLWEEAISKRENTDRKDLLAARVAFGVMFLIVLVAIAGIYVVGGKC
jgi:hypothetical protein